MKPKTKRILYHIKEHIIIIIVFIALDTLQSFLFNTSPVIHERTCQCNNAGILYIDQGIFIEHYVYIDGSAKNYLAGTLHLYSNKLNSKDLFQFLK